jgi:uncharacterized protein YndB with AHSA1/START domain
MIIFVAVYKPISHNRRMKKQKINIERELKSNSQSIIWELISSASGLSRWVADTVEQDGGRLTFTWGEVWSHHEIKSGLIKEVVKNSYIRFQWENEDDEDAYIELRMEMSDLTNDFILIITDFTEPDDAETLKGLWEDDLDRLRQNTGYRFTEWIRNPK